MPPTEYKSVNGTGRNLSVTLDCVHHCAKEYVAPCDSDLTRKSIELGEQTLPASQIP